jgi:uncharacterized protein (TIGR01777 family)
MRVIITGGTGLIGRALAANLAFELYEVIVLTRHPERVTRLPQGVQAVGWDGRTAAGWGGLADGADVIVNLAGESIAAGRWTEARKRRILESRVNAGRAVVEAVKAATRKPSVVIQASAVGYYGPHGDEEVTEATPSGHDFLAHVCREWEASSAEVEKLGVRRAILRTGLVLSRVGGPLPLMRLPFFFFVGGPLGSGKQWFPWIHIADEIGAIRFAMKKPDAQGVFNLCSPNPLTNADFSRALAKVMHRPSFLPAPAFAVRLLLGEMSTLLLDGQREIPQRLQQLGFSFRFAEAEPALRDLLG